MTATTTDSVNLRSGPGTANERLTTVDPGTSLEVTGRNADATWVQVAYPESTSRAWVSAEYVDVSGDLATAPVASSPPEAEEAPEAQPTAAAAAGASQFGVPNLKDLPTHTEDGRPIVYFTFDDGPQPGNTDVISALFDEHDGDATFFMVGKSVSAYPDLVRTATTGGNYIADHTWDHGDLAGMTHEQFVSEVERTREAILQAAGDLFGLDKDVRYVRPPYGSTDANTRQYAAELGMTVVLWTIDPQDWRRPGAQVIADHILSHVQPGSIVLSHDGGGDRSQTLEAYRTVLPQLASQGYVFRNIFVP
jgi:peptidoglycan/xylan/chitin deacetylase (PgdA/CDA1 family)